MTPKELEELKNFAKNTKGIVEELERMLVKFPAYYNRISDCNWRFGDMSILCDEIVELVDKEMKDNG